MTNSSIRVALKYLRKTTVEIQPKGDLLLYALFQLVKGRNMGMDYKFKVLKAKVTILCDIIFNDGGIGKRPV